ncbi:putative uncharacterized protein [Firmicutes bacterium CAG:791]|nr:putative uncharacterized protein [Firmicutes bacterium CAG:791]
MRKKILTGKLTAVMTAAALMAAATACSAGTNAAPAEGSTEAVTEAAPAEESTEAVTEAAADASANTEDNVTTEEAGTTETTESAENAGDSGTLRWENISRSADTKLKLSVTDKELEEASENTDLPFSTRIQYVKVDESGYDALQKALDKDNADSLELAKEEYSYNAEDLKNMVEENESAAVPFALESTVLKKRADDKVVSYLRESYSQLGGAHPSTFFAGKNYDTKTGSELTLQDVVANYDDVYQYVLDELAKNEKQPENENCYFDGYEDTVKEMFYGNSDSESAVTDANSEETGLYPMPASSVQWYLGDDGLNILFNDYDIAPYAYGPSLVTIPYDSGLIAGEYAE